MNWWKRFKMEKLLSEDEKNSFLTYLRLENELTTEHHSNNAMEFPAIQYDLKHTLTKTYTPSEEWIQWAGFYLMQSSNRYGISMKHHTIVEEFFSAGVKFAKEINPYSSQNIVCIADFPTIQLLSFALGAKEVCEPILNFDTLPHPLGISSATIALELLNQWKNHFETSMDRTIPLLLLDSNRLVQYTDTPSLIDNRSTAKLPTIESLKKKNIQTIVYATNSEVDVDDVHEDFCYYVNAGISLLWFNTQKDAEIREKHFVKRSTMFSKRTSFINKV